MKAIVIGALVTLGTLAAAQAQTKNVNIVKAFDGKIARCGEMADVGNRAYRLKNGAVVLNENNLTLRMDVESLVCAENTGRSRVGLIPQAPGVQATRGVLVTNQKLLLVDESYKTIAAHALDAKNVTTQTEMVIGLTEDQKAALSQGQDIQVKASAFVQAITKSQDGANLTGSGEFDVTVQVSRGAGTMSIK